MKKPRPKPQSSRHPASFDELRREFALADRDRDGRIDIAEFRMLLEGLEAGMSQHEMYIGFQEVDTDHDGFVDRKEFIDWWSSD